MSRAAPYMSVPDWEEFLRSEGLVSVRPTDPDFLNAVALVQRGLAEILPNCTHDQTYVDIVARTEIEKSA